MGLAQPEASEAQIVLSPGTPKALNTLPQEEPPIKPLEELQEEPPIKPLEELYSRKSLPGT
jgi:hypothetical protein